MIIPWSVVVAVLLTGNGGGGNTEVNYDEVALPALLISLL